MKHAPYTEPLYHSIIDMLQSYHPSSPRQQQLKHHFLSHRHPQSCRKDFLSPGHFTASGFVCTPDMQQLVLIFHHRFQKWIQPGGHLEKTDTHILEAAKREIAEETGLTQPQFTGRIHLDLHHVPKTSKQSAHEHWDIQLLFTHTHTPLNGDLRGVWTAIKTLSQDQSDESVMRFVEILL